MSVPFFWVAPIQGPLKAKIGQKCTYKTDGFWSSVHPFYWVIDGNKSKKGKKEIDIKWDKEGIHTLKVREGCPFLGESAHSDWSDKIKVEVTK
jgi:hypothetical protein